MKLLKRISLFLLSLTALFFIIGLFAPKTFIGKVEIIIDKPNQEVFNYVKHLKNQDNFGIWNLKESDIKKDFFGEDGTIGFIYEWEGTKSSTRKGKQVIANIVEGEKIESLIYLNDSPDFTISQISTYIISDNQSKVEWVILGKMPYPSNVLGIFTHINKDLQEGLDKLKKELEK